MVREQEQLRSLAVSPPPLPEAAPEVARGTVPEAVAGAVWACGACTFLNAGGVGACEMCGTATERSLAATLPERPLQMERESEMLLTAPHKAVEMDAQRDTQMEVEDAGVPEEQDQRDEQQAVPMEAESMEAVLMEAVPMEAESMPMDASPAVPPCPPAAPFLAAQMEDGEAAQSLAAQIEASEAATRTMQVALQRLEGSTDVPQRKEALSTLCKLVRNLLSNPSLPKYRHIRLDNLAFHRRVGVHAGGVDVLKAAGFTEIAGQELAWNRNDPGLLWLAQSVLQSSLAQIESSA